MGGFVHGHWVDSITAEEAAARDSGSPAPQAPRPAQSSQQSAPPPAAPTGYDTNSYEGRQALRDQGYYIDDSGIYAPGAGNRVGDTWSGSQASHNVAPSPTQLPILNGHPVSPSNGFTGEQTPYIMYRGDPMYAGLFGTGTPGYSSTSRSANALPGSLPSGQQTYEGAFGAPSMTPRVPQPAPTPAMPNTSVSAPAAMPTANPQATDDPYANSASTNASAPQALPYQAELQQQNQNGLGYGPYATAQPPQLTVQGRYVENGKVIEKSIDQYGNQYYQTVDTAVGQPNTPQPVTQPAPAAQSQAQQTATANSATAQPTTVAQPVGATPRTIVGMDGKPYTLNLTDQDYANVLADQKAAADAEKQAREFNQGLEQQKVDISRAIATWNQTYQQALIQQGDRKLAQDAANQALLADLQRQALELQKQQQENTVAIEREKLAAAQSQQAQNMSLEREKLALARKQGSGRRRGLPQVHYR